MLPFHCKHDDGQIRIKIGHPYQGCVKEGLEPGPRPLIGDKRSLKPNHLITGEDTVRLDINQIEFFVDRIVTP